MKRFSAFRHALMAVPMLLALGACTTYEYVPPSSDAGRACAAQCEQPRQSCIASAQDRAEAGAKECRQTRAFTLALCLAGANDKAQKEKCHERAPACVAIPMTESCEASFRRCYTSCGGRVIEVD